MATVAYYGPDDRRAPKVSVGIIMAEGGNAEFLERWYSETGDVRLYAFINEQILKRVHSGRLTIGGQGRLSIDKLAAQPGRHHGCLASGAKPMRRLPGAGYVGTLGIGTAAI